MRAEEEVTALVHWLLLVLEIGDQPVDRLDRRLDEVGCGEVGQWLPLQVLSTRLLHRDVLNDCDVLLEQLGHFEHGREHTHREAVGAHDDARRLSRHAMHHVTEQASLDGFPKVERCSIGFAERRGRWDRRQWGRGHAAAWLVVARIRHVRLFLL